MPDDNKQDWLRPRSPANLPTTSAPPAGGPKPPSPPPPEINLRTMKSDLESLKETGGSAPAPKPFTPPELKKEFALPPPPPKITPAEFGEPKKTEAPKIEEETAGTGKKKKLAVWLGSLIVVVGAGLAGYYLIFPLLFPPQAPPPTPAVTQPPITEAPVAAVPLAETAPAKNPHQSLLTASDSSASAELAAINLDSLTAALKEKSQSASPNTLTEVALSDANGQLLSSSVLNALLPEISPEAIKNLFEDDFTAALYADTNGSWPAYILKLKTEASQVEAQTEINKLESSLNLANLFLENPGTPNSAGFKTGQANGAATRYLTFAKQGAGLNIAWSGDKLIISTSYNGLKKVLVNL
ncbi:MAG: hypothetical protein HYY86_01620 [Candidatus Harrisonbacteria bacterium]|nr:hypothetical protein [Candidatus Harrisonbacteria bacterium]